MKTKKEVANMLERLKENNDGSLFIEKFIETLEWWLRERNEL